MSQLAVLAQFFLLFPDSGIVAKYSFGKIKVSAFISQKFLESTQKLYIEQMENKLFFISTDASNKGNVNTFFATYFDQNHGVKINFGKKNSVFVVFKN